MAIAWLTVFKSVPWTEVISNAPKVADGAKKLWNAVSKKSPVQEPSAESTELPLSTDAQALAALQARLAATEIATAELHNQMLESSELIKTLANQNAQLIKRIEANRLRVAWLSAATVVVGCIAVLGLTLAV